MEIIADSLLEAIDWLNNNKDSVFYDNYSNNIVIEQDKETGIIIHWSYYDKRVSGKTIFVFYC